MLALSLTFPETLPKVETFPLLLSDLRNLTKGNAPSSALRLSSSPANTLSDLQDPPGHHVRKRGLSFLWGFLFHCVEHKEKASLLVNGLKLVLKEWRVRDSSPAPISMLPLFLWPSWQSWAFPLHPNEGRWNGLNLQSQCSHCRLWRSSEQSKPVLTN